MTDFGTVGVGFPHTVAWSLPHAGLAGVVAAIPVGAAVAVYLGRFPGTGRANHPGGYRRDWLRLGLAGIIVFALGYTIFLTTGRVGLIIVNALGSFWAEGWRLQPEVLADVHAAFPVLPSGSTLLLDGVSPYVGPAHVFASHWDLRGALLVHHRDPSLDAGVTSANVAVDEQGIETRVSRWEVRYPYGSDLLLPVRPSNGRVGGSHRPGRCPRAPLLVTRRRMPAGRPGDRHRLAAVRHPPGLGPPHLGAVSGSLGYCSTS